MHGGLALLVDALNFAAARHATQRRKDAGASPYVNHLIAAVHVLAVEAGVDDARVLAAAALHDTLEDTPTSAAEIGERFGGAIRDIVLELTDDKSRPKAERKQRQIAAAPHASHAARLVKLADKICNLRDMADAPPARWDLARRREYFDWAHAVVAGLRGTHAGLERLFDAAYARRP